MNGPRTCAVVPTYENPLTVRRVVEGIRERGLEVILVDDGSSSPGDEACKEIETAGLATRIRLARNSGKGAAVKAGFQRASELGFTHAFQIDADGQHDLDRIADFLEASTENPEALILAYPVYDETAPRHREIGRRFTTMWVALEVGSRTAIRDALIGFRIYPLASSLGVGRTGDRMDFDVEIAVRLVRAGTPTVNLPVRVHYPTEEEGGVSHFRMFQDNVRFSFLHGRLCTAGCLQWLRRAVTKR